MNGDSHSNLNVNHIGMELSINWKKLKATLNAEASRKRSHSQSSYEARSPKRKQPPAPAPKPSKKLKLNKTHMEIDIAPEQVNEGLLKRYCLLGLIYSVVLNH